VAVVLWLSIVEGPCPLAHLIAREAPTLSDGLLPTSSSVARGFVPLAEGWCSTWRCGSEPAWRMPGCRATLGEADMAVQMPQQGFAEHTVAFMSTLGLGGDSVSSALLARLNECLVWLRVFLESGDFACGLHGMGQ
jgi:hypothetical protein